MQTYNYGLNNIEDYIIQRCVTKKENVKFQTAEKAIGNIFAKEHFRPQKCMAIRT